MLLLEDVYLDIGVLENLKAAFFIFNPASVDSCNEKHIGFVIIAYK